MRQLFHDSNKFNLVITLLMVFQGVTSAIQHQWGWVVAFAVFGVLNLWATLPPYVRARIRGHL